MRPVDFPGANKTFTAPHGEEERVYSLRAFVDETVPQVVECWRPTMRERLSVLLFGRVWIAFLARSPQPVAIEGRRTSPFFKLEEPS
jgi:hypothetical protein